MKSIIITITLSILIAMSGWLLGFFQGQDKINIFLMEYIKELEKRL